MATRTKPLSTGAIGKLLGVDRTTVWGWIRSGKLPAERTVGGQYRVDHGQLANLLREKEITVPQELSTDHPRRILIADDDPGVLTFLETALRRHSSDLELATATNGFTAGKLVASFRPHVAVVDIQMPGLGGLDVCDDIKRDKATRHIKLVVVTGYPTPENLERARRIGVERFLEKPIEVKAFVETIRELLAE